MSKIKYRLSNGKKEPVEVLLRGNRGSKTAVLITVTSKEQEIGADDALELESKLGSTVTVIRPAVKTNAQTETEETETETEETEETETEEENPLKNYTTAVLALVKTHKKDEKWLEKIKGTGVDGRIVKADVEAALEAEKS